MFEPMVCTCGCWVIRETIMLDRGDMPMEDIAQAKFCPKCRKIHGIRLVGHNDHGITLRMVDRLYSACPMNCYTLEEYKTGELPTGFVQVQQKQSSYNPDRFIEQDTKGLY